MARLNKIEIEVKTGDARGPEEPTLNINGFPLPFSETEGGTGSGETLKAVGNPQSFPHGLALVGPEEGQPAWDIETVTATYYCQNMEPYTVHMGAVTIDDQSNLNVWQEPPAKTFDV